MKIGIIGLGLMGGSLGKTLKKIGGHEVFGYDNQETVMLKADMLGAINAPLDETTAKDIDMLIVSLYPSSFLSSIERFLPLLKDGAVITDFCGIKRKTMAEMKELSKKYPNLIFVGGHPMAGREFSGIDRSVSGLFEKASMILTNVNADIFTLEKIKAFYLTLGFSEVVITTPEYHDRAIAFTSQLCHIVSNAFIKNEIASEHFGYSAGSYKDLTRVARLNPKMWSELMIENGDNLSKELDEFIENLQKYSVALKNGDRVELEKLLSEGNERKLLIDTKNKK
ncbi:MAG: prephenate dehydrogenase/arogenate dehydrogenase family protein [Clostridia bacterium]|jgi:prephenate dehydrogenase|nr:prephenate dehydrogenase/arogenate dehydrogenase family protein [Clostridia bacterium]